MSFPLRKVLFIAAGGAALSLGILGVFLPVLPTTPFILLAAWCWAKSSARLHTALLRHRWTGPIIENYRTRRGISLRNKIVSIGLLWLTISFSGVLVTARWLAAGKALWPFRWLLPFFLLIVAVSVTLHIARFKTL